MTEDEEIISTVRAVAEALRTREARRSELRERQKALSEELQAVNEALREFDFNENENLVLVDLIYRMAGLPR